MPGCQAVGGLPGEMRTVKRDARPVLSSLKEQA